MYNLRVAGSLFKQVYIAEGLAPPRSLQVIQDAYKTMYARAIDANWWTNLAKSGEWQKTAIYAIEAYGIFHIGQMVSVINSFETCQGAHTDHNFFSKHRSAEGISLVTRSIKRLHTEIIINSLYYLDLLCKHQYTFSRATAHILEKNISLESLQVCVRVCASRWSATMCSIGLRLSENDIDIHRRQAQLSLFGKDFTRIEIQCVISSRNHFGHHLQAISKELFHIIQLGHIDRASFIVRAFSRPIVFYC